MASVKGRNLDGNENWMTDRLVNALNPATTSVARVAVSFAAVDGVEVARLEVAASPEPV